jgi:hypothetical protein
MLSIYCVKNVYLFSATQYIVNIYKRRLQMLWETISKKLSEKNWTIYKLCLEAGIGTAGIYRLRDGVIKDLQFETVRKIADALDMSLEEFR